MSIAKYIDDLKLSDVNSGPSPFSDLEPDLGPLRSANESTEGEIPASLATPPDLQAAVDAGSLLSFVEGVNSEEKDDILCSIQLAQRGASGAFDRFTQTQSWYQMYIEILENVGWAAEQFALARFDQDEGEFRMDQAALAIIGAIASQNQLLVLKEAIGALEKLTEDDGTIRLFDFHTSAEMSGNFQIGAVQKAENEALSLALGAFSFRATDKRRRFLFFKWGRQKVNFWTGAQKMTLNSAMYEFHREMVKEKLGAAAAKFIGNLVLV